MECAFCFPGSNKVFGRFGRWICTWIKGGWVECRQKVCCREQRQDHRWELLAWEPRKTQDIFFICDQPHQWYNPQAQVRGAPAGQDHRPQETPDLWVVMVSREVHHKGSMEARVRHLARQVAIKEIQVRPALDFGNRHATALDFGNWLTVAQQMIGDVSYTSAQLWLQWSRHTITGCKRIQSCGSGWHQLCLTWRVAGLHGETGR